MHARAGWLYAFLFCLSLVSGFSQQNVPAVKPRVSPPDNADHRMTLDVFVSEKSGKPILGLQQRDFTLLDGKEPLNILSFHAVQGGSATPDPPVEVVLLLDEVNTDFTTVAREREQIEKFLRQNGGKLARPVSMAFLSDSGITIGAAPSQDGNAVIADLAQKQSGLRDIGRSEGVEGASERFQLSLNALGQLIKYEAPSPGRKLVVWFGPGWPLLSNPGLVDLSAKEKEGLFNSIVEVSDALRQARMTLYSVDPLTGTEDYQSFTKAVKTEKQAQYGDLALQVLAEQSGGRDFYSNNDLAGEIAACVAEANAFYVLSFDALPADGPNEYHALEIKVDKPGVTGRGRSGYYAQPDHRRQ